MAPNNEKRLLFWADPRMPNLCFQTRCPPALAMGLMGVGIQHLEGSRLGNDEKHPPHCLVHIPYSCLIFHVLLLCWAHEVCSLGYSFVLWLTICEAMARDCIVLLSAVIILAGQNLRCVLHWKKELFTRALPLCKSNKMQTTQGLRSCKQNS